MEVRGHAVVVTLYGLYNYGNRLQNLAVQESLRKRGFSPTSLMLKRHYPVPTLRDLAGRVGHSLSLRGKASAKYRRFLEFDKHVSSKRVWGERQLERLGKRCDLVVIGSDQIWNSTRIHRNGAEFGRFALHAKKIALSPSFGTSFVAEERRDEYALGLRSVDALSVREFSGQDIIRDLVGVEAPVLIDPTMSLTVDEWRAVSDRRRVPSSPYAMIYLLGDTEESKRDAVEAYVRERGLEPVVIMLPESKYFDAGPQDFLAFIDGAELVVTDSFHATVFSLLFDTECCIVERKDRPMGSRFDTLMRHFDLNLKIPSGAEPGRLVQVDRSVFDSKLEELIDEYDAYLDAAIL